MKPLSLALAALVLALGAQAQAATLDLSFSGGAVSGALAVTYGPETDAKYPGAFRVTGVSGTVSNATLGIEGAAAGALVPVNDAEPDATNLLAPGDFSRFAVAAGLPPENRGSLSFDNLLWPAGSPQTATDYPFGGGVLDIYGLLFSIGDGRYVNLWSNGVLPGAPGPDYGIAFVTSDEVLDYTGGLSLDAGPAPVPVPASLGLILAALGGLAALRRRVA